MNIENKPNSLSSLFALFDDTDIQGTITSISNGISIKGTNIWMLFCSAILASIGLDTGSTAVIIGAMLVSPLMSPILGIGLSVGINDRSLLWRSIKNFGIAVILSLVVSSIYFAITPLGEATSELTARTSPTLLDVGIAFFGGIAGIVAGSRKEKTTAIPGVAIATALMPPLCTTGFGIATGNLTYLLGSFYLFFLNTTFISLATYIVVRWLKFPFKEFADATIQKQVKLRIAIFAIIVIIPSTFIFYGVIQDLRINKKIQIFITEKVNSPKRSVLRWEIIGENSDKSLKIYIFGEPFSQDEATSLKQQLVSYHLEGLHLDLIQTNVPERERKLLSTEIQKNILDKVAVIQQNQEKIDKEKDNKIGSLNKELVQLKGDPTRLASIIKEVKILVPEVSTLSFATLMKLPSVPDASEKQLEKKQKETPQEDVSKEPSYIVLVSFNKRLSAKNQKELIDKLELFLKERFETDLMKIVVL